MCSVRYGLGVLSASVLTVPPSCSNRCSALVIVTNVWNDSKFATRWLYLINLRSSRTFFGDHSFAAETHPLYEFVERLT